MDFSTAHGAPIVVTIDGTRYTVPRFKLSHFKAWAALRAEETLTKALEGIGEDPERRARFRMYWAEPAFDVAAIAEDLRTPAGVVHVLETCLGEAGVPKETVAALIDGGNAMELRVLAGQLAGVDRAIAQMQQQSGDGGKGSDPTREARHTSEGSPTTGQAPPPASDKPSDSALKIA